MHEGKSLKYFLFGVADELVLSDKECSEEEEIGGLFKVMRKKSEKDRLQRDTHGLDCSKFTVSHIQDWSLSEVSRVKNTKII